MRGTAETHSIATPFKYGMAGATDTHNGLSATEEDNFFAKFPIMEPSAGRWDEDASKQPGQKQGIKGWQVTAGGYMGVWATGNTREEKNCGTR